MFEIAISTLSIPVHDASLAIFRWITPRQVNELSVLIIVMLTHTARGVETK